MTLTELIERLEQYDPALSADNGADELELHHAIVTEAGGTINPAFEATFIRSVDAAMTLLDPGSDLRLGRTGPHWGAEVSSDDPRQVHGVFDCPTAALAVTIACLRARVPHEA